MIIIKILLVIILTATMITIAIMEAAHYNMIKQSPTRRPVPTSRTAPPGGRAMYICMCIYIYIYIYIQSTYPYLALLPHLALFIHQAAGLLRVQPDRRHPRGPPHDMYMYIYMYIYIYTYIYIYLSICLSISLSLSIYIYITTTTTITTTTNNNIMKMIIIMMMIMIIMIIASKLVQS